VWDRAYSNHVTRHRTTLDDTNGTRNAELNCTKRTVELYLAVSWVQ